MYGKSPHYEYILEKQNQITLVFKEDLEWEIILFLSKYDFVVTVFLKFI